MKTKNPSNKRDLAIVVSWDALHPETEIPARALAQHLQLPLISLTTPPFPPPSSFPFYHLQVSEQGLSLIVQNEEGRQSTLFLDFLKGPLQYRRLQGGGLKQDLVRAVGLKKKHQTLSVLDATAGLGRDAFVLASQGCTVTLLERSPIIAALLEDALRRASVDPEVKPIVCDRMKLNCLEAKILLKSLINTHEENSQYDVIYLDPMFPERVKSALTKIELRLIGDIVGKDEDAEELFLLALKTGVKRVVVKRPRHAPSLCLSPKPNFVVRGKKNRYDVYLQVSSILNS